MNTPTLELEVIPPEVKSASAELSASIRTAAEKL